MNAYDMIHYAPFIAFVLAGFMIAVAFCIPEGATSRLGLFVMTLAGILVVASVLHVDDGRTFIEIAMTKVVYRGY